MPVAVAIPAAIAVAGLVEGAVSSHAASQAAEAQQNDIKAAQAAQEAQYQDTVRREEPFVTAGQAASATLQNKGGPAGSLGRQFALADYEKAPSYQANLQAAMRAIGNSGSARGGALSGGTINGQIRDASNMAGNSFGQAQAGFINNQQQNIKTLQGTVQTGIQAANGENVAGTALANEVGQNGVNLGNAAAAGSIGENKAWMGGISTAMNQVMPIVNGINTPQANLSNLGTMPSSSIGAPIAPIAGNGVNNFQWTPNAGSLGTYGQPLTVGS